MSNWFETVVCAYLDTLGLDPRHTGGVATALWIESLRQAASADRTATKALAQKLRADLKKLPHDASIDQVAGFETASRSAVFELIDASYIEVFFGINSAFSRKQVLAMYDLDQFVKPNQVEFVERWRQSPSSWNWRPLRKVTRCSR